MTKSDFILIQLKYLHDVQLKMIDEVVDKSDLSQAKQLIEYIMKKELK